MLGFCAVAETIGVCAEPEIETLDLIPAHLFLVLASDGVFEFMSNDEVVQLVRLCSLHAPAPSKFFGCSMLAVGARINYLVSWGGILGKNLLRWTCQWTLSIQ